ncbi:cytochrome P450 9e2-like [Schistocerca piceifrons]|uniref:cytochrome P450 9e2-like n=1 Tax=Schistocerca piceifrons TaxID=274613 RepID=UPI001F5F15E3|nr:cytochrome P450 9e2-like [Schistocerca piceifrons]
MSPDWWTLPLPLLVVLVVVVVVWWWRRWSGHFARQGTPSLRPLPFVGNMLLLAFRKLAMHDIVIQLYHKLDPHAYGGFFLFSVPLVMIRDPEIIRTVTVKDFDHFTDHFVLFGNSKHNPMLRRMLFSLKGREWHDMRCTLSPAFSSMKMKNMFLLMTEIGHQMVEYLTKKTAEHEISSGGEGTLTLEMKDFFTRMTNDIIATTAFGVKVDSLSEPNNSFYTMGRDLTTFRPTVAFGYLISPKLMELLRIPFLDPKAVDYFTSIISETIRTREKHGIIRHDMIHLMMQARRGELTSQEEEVNGTTEVKGKPPLTDEDVTAQAVIFFFGGFDTVSSLMVFSSYLLATHPDVQRRLQREVDDVMQKSGGQPSYEEVLGCQYLDMVLSETLRMYAPLPSLDRQCVRPYRLPAAGRGSCPGLELRPGDGVWLPVHAIHHDEKYFPDPDRFDPERFSPENKHLIKPFTYFPFGCGPRFCIAQRFALMETKVVLLHMLSKFSLQIVPKTPVPLKIQPKPNLLIQGGAWLGLRRRT